MKPTLCAVLSIFALSAVLHADEIRLKDGSKIVGNVVGVEDGAFKIETAYGFAMVRKDSIAEIVPMAETKPAETKPAASRSAASKPAEDATPTAKPSTSAGANPAPPTTAEAKAQATPGKLVEAAEPKSRPTQPKPAAYVGAKTQPASTASAPPTTPPLSNAKQVVAQTPVVPGVPASSQPSAQSANSAPAAAPAASAAAAPAAPPAPPPAPPEPLPVREMVRGNLYINQTYGFQMYRAPDWQPIVAARDGLPNAIAALGTSDQSTLVIIGRERAQETLEPQAAATEKAVQEVYENYRPMPLQRITVAGSPAVERQFRGLAENHDWAVTLVTLERGGDVFTILAMTDANSELVQLQANVIAKAIASLQFTAPTPAGPVPLPN